MTFGPTKLGLVGLGWWGQVLLKSALDHPDTYKFTAAAGPSAADKEVATIAGLSHFATLDDLLDRGEVEAVVLATPHSMHASQVTTCAERGVAVYTEKPLALTVNAARAAIEACNRAGVTLGIGTDKRFLPSVEALTRLVRDGTLGRVLHVEANYSNDNMSGGLSGSWRNDPREAPGGALTGPALHVLDAVVSLVGPPESVRAQLLTHPDLPGVVDTLRIDLQLSSRVTGSLSSVRGVPDYFRIAVYGTKGWAEVLGFGVLRVSESGSPTSWTTFPGDLRAGELLQRFAEGLATGSSFPVTTTSMLHTTASLEAAVRSIETGGAIRISPDLEVSP
ncbi:Gfo/Idh/MocA family protein [Nocardioides sp.]|uniref:Gfo/Idh/MocA family protein n=1 Tax=Nocardioides sp. TaxID=35761 RepID=UPI0037837077